MLEQSFSERCSEVSDSRERCSRVTESRLLPLSLWKYPAQATASIPAARHTCELQPSIISVRRVQHRAASLRVPLTRQRQHIRPEAAANDGVTAHCPGSRKRRSYSKSQATQADMLSCCIFRQKVGTRQSLLFSPRTSEQRLYL